MSRKVLPLAMSVVLLPVLAVLLEAQATGAPPQKPPAAPKVAPKPVVGGGRAILKALKEPVSFEFKETPLQDVIDYLGDKHHIPIVLDKKELESMNIGSDTLVTKNLKGISLRSALKLMLDELGLKSVIYNEILLITSPTKAESDEFLITKVYDVADLVLPGPMDYPYRGDRLPGPSVETATQARVGDYDSLIDLITRSIAPKCWGASGGPPADIAVYGLSLVINQTRDVHDQIEALLAQLRAKQRATPTVVVDFQWLWLERGPYQQLVGDGALASSHVPSAIDEKVLDRVARKAAGFRGRVVCTNHQLVHLASGDRRSVIAGATPTVEVKPAPNPGGMGMPAGPGAGMGGMFSVASSIGPIGPIGPSARSNAAQPPAPAPTPAAAVPPPQPPTPLIAGQTVYQPVIDVPNVGVVVEVRPSVAPGADTAVLDIRSTVTRWGKPSPPTKVGGAGSASCPVDRPNMPAAEMAMTARVPLGKPVLLGAVTFAPADGAGLDKATDAPVQLCLIATTSIATDANKKKPAKK
ncbi:MAG: hypothetical protein ABSG86_28365 [Thermoguttaceae bacterium]